MIIDLLEALIRREYKATLRYKAATATRDAIKAEMGFLIQEMREDFQSDDEMLKWASTNLSPRHLDIVKSFLLKQNKRNGQ